MGNVRAVSRPSHETNPDQDARARAWAFVFDCYRTKEATRPGGPDDGTKSKEDSANADIIQK